MHEVCTKAILLGERSVRIREVKGSNPSRSTNLPHRFVRCGVFYVQKPLADRAGLRTLKLDANRAGFPGGVPGTGDLQAAESGLHSPARMRYTTLEVITMRRKFWLLAAVCLLVCLLAGCGSKEQTVTPDFVLTYADNQPADYPTTQGAERFAALVKERTGGKVVIQVKSGGEYGTEQEVWQQLSIGGIDFARLSLSVLAADLPKLNVLQLPCLYEDAAHMWRVLDGPIGEEFLRVFAERDMVGLSWYDAGARSFYSDKSLRSLEDLQGMTIRVQDANVVIDMVKLLGGDPVTLAYSDVYAAFETDKIDAAENNWPAYLAMEHYKVARYYLVDEHSRVPEIQLASGKTWAKLPDEYRSVLRECARESARYERELWTQQEAAARKTVLAAGCREIQLSDEEKERFRELVQPLYEKYAGPYLELVKKIQQG